MEEAPKNLNQMNDIEFSVINNHGIFSSFSNEEIGEISHLFARSSLPTGSTLFHQGDHGASMYIVEKGKIKLCIFSENGNELILKILHPGELFGELAMLGRTNRDVSAVALEHCEILTIDRHDWMPILIKRPDVAWHMLQLVNRKLRRATQYLEELAFCKGYSRLARHFLRLADFKGRRTEIGISIDLPLSQQQIGDMVGLTRESTNKYLAKWRSYGYLTWNKKKYTIIDTEKLTQISAGKIS